VLEEDVENQMDRKGEKLRGIQKNLRRKDCGAKYAKEEQNGLAT
jgi:hypothetical protein